MVSLRKGVVVQTHPEDYSVDLVMVDDGARLVGVQVLSPTASTRTGNVDLPAVAPKADKWDITHESDQEILAVVGYLGRFPVVLGFIYPQISQMTFDDPRRKISRHQSDVYYTVDGVGDMELFHPSGTYVRIAQSPLHEDLRGKNTDKNLSIDRNTQKQVHFHVRMAGGAASIDIAPGGAITILTQSTFDVHAQGEVTVRAPKVTLDTPLVEVPDGDVVASGVSLVTHRHGGVSAGNDTTGTPVSSS